METLWQKSLCYSTVEVSILMGQPSRNNLQRMNLWGGLQIQLSHSTGEGSFKDWLQTVDTQGKVENCIQEVSPGHRCTGGGTFRVKTDGKPTESGSFTEGSTEASSLERSSQEKSPRYFHSERGEIGRESCPGKRTGDGRGWYIFSLVYFMNRLLSLYLKLFVHHVELMCKSRVRG